MLIPISRGEKNLRDVTEDCFTRIASLPDTKSTHTPVRRNEEDPTTSRNQTNQKKTGAKRRIHAVTLKTKIRIEEKRSPHK